MKKFNYLKYYVIAAGVFLAMAGKASAADSTGFTFIAGDKSFPISQELLDSWRGLDTFTPASSVLPQPQSFKNSLLQSVGQAQAPQTRYKIYSYRLAPIYNYVNSLAQNLNIPKTEPNLEMQDGKVIKFTPPQDGQQVDVYKSALDTLNALQIGNLSVSLTYYQTHPTQSLANTNNLGINELVAEGVSTFNGSPHNRRVNIAVGIEKFKGLVIPKGATFSFNDNLGPVTAEAGFLPELVIKGSEGTIPELGGGLCQVSSTTFRAAMAAGLPITERRNHAYAVQYYAPQGTDATIYPGSVDLKFVNDTPGDILIWPYEKDNNTLVFDFYGTKDARQVTLEKPVQYNKKTDGSMKATWTREVISATGQQRTDVFKSTYQPPALFHKTEEFVSATGTPSTGLHVGTPTT